MIFIHLVKNQFDQFEKKTPIFFFRHPPIPTTPFVYRAVALDEQWFRRP